MDENADSSFDMNAAQESLSNDLFPEHEKSENIEEEVESEIEENDQTEEEPEESEEEPEESEEEIEDVFTAPQSWKKDMHEKFNSLDKDTKEYILLREEQMKEGLEKDRMDANVGRTMRDIIEPHQNLLQSQGIHGEDAVKFFMNAHVRLTTASPENQLYEAKEFLKAYGINLDQGETTPEMDSLRNEIGMLRNQLNQNTAHSEQIERDRVTKEVEAFASQQPYFDEVAEDIVPLINAGYSLEEAYQKAIWMNEETRQKEIDRLQQESIEASKKRASDEAQKAKKAKSVNVGKSNTNKAPTEPLGTMEDTLHDVYREIQNR